MTHPIPAKVRDAAQRFIESLLIPQTRDADETDEHKVARLTEQLLAYLAPHLVHSPVAPTCGTDAPSTFKTGPTPHLRVTNAFGSTPPAGTATPREGHEPYCDKLLSGKQTCNCGYDTTIAGLRQQLAHATERLAGAEKELTRAPSCGHCRGEIGVILTTVADQGIKGRKILALQNEVAILTERIDGLRSRLTAPTDEAATTCPFCRETGFDEVGLKIHLNAGHCEPFTKLSTSLPVTRAAQSAQEGEKK